MKNDYTNTFVLNSLNLPFVTDINTLSTAMSLSPSMIYLLSKKSADFYKEFTVEKTSGHKRIISSPSLPMKLVQRWILEQILEKIKVSRNSMAFVKGLSGCKKNAEIHHDSLYILHLDIKDFFPSIDKKRVYGLFRNLGYNNSVSNLLANLCTLNGSLPQGGATSPYISNLICSRLDRRLSKLCSIRDILYTRYADDLIFSCDNKIHLQKIKNIIEDIIISEGFTLNEKKTRILSRYGKMQVNGITLNDEKLKVDKKIKRMVRAKIHHMFAKADFKEVNVVRGYISYISSIEDDYLEKITAYINKLMESDFNHHDDIVDAYNSSKILKKSSDMIFEPFPFVDDFDFSDISFSDYSIDTRNEFLIRNNYIEDSNKSLKTISNFEDFF